MKCTLIIGPQGAGKSTVAKQLASKFPDHEVRWLFSTESRKVVQSHSSLQFYVKPDCRLIISDTIETIAGLKNWLFLTMAESIISNAQYREAKRIQPEFVLVFQTDLLIEEIISPSLLRHVQVIQCVDIHKTLEDLSNF